jgi:hypothetical protein
VVSAECEACDGLLSSPVMRVGWARHTPHFAGKPDTRKVIVLSSAFACEKYLSSWRLSFFEKIISQEMFYSSKLRCLISSESNTRL